MRLVIAAKAPSFADFDLSFFIHGKLIFSYFFRKIKIITVCFIPFLSCTFYSEPAFMNTHNRTKSFALASAAAALMMLSGCSKLQAEEAVTLNIGY